MVLIRGQGVSYVMGKNNFYRAKFDVCGVGGGRGERGGDRVANLVLKVFFCNSSSPVFLPSLRNFIASV